MRRGLLLVVLAFVFPACKGEKGDAGPAGPSGPSSAPENAPDIQTFEGTVTSDDQLVFLGEFGTDYALSVYIGDSLTFTELPYYLPSEGVNVFYVADGFGVRILRAQTAAATRYRITLIRNGVGAGLAELGF